MNARLGGVHDPDRAGADDRHRVALAEATGPRHGGRQVEAVGDGEQLGEHGDAGRQPLGHEEHRRAWPEVEVLGPTAEQVRRLRRRE